MAASVSRSAALRRPRLLLLPQLPGAARPGPRPRLCSSGPLIMQPPLAARGWLSGLRFDNRALQMLPVEEPPPSGDPAPRPVPGACFSRVRPSPLREPRLVALSAPALALLGLDPPPPPPPPGAGPESEEEVEEQKEEAEAGGATSRRRRPASGAEAEVELYFSGNALLPGSEPAAHCYCGHQFGSFAGQLGDGAAMYLGEVLGPDGQRWELQLKGAGLTPFSRQADGRKVLRSSIREFLCSEAMFHLGIPTTRAGSCVTSESKVIRDIYYDGNPKYENCAVVLRIASTFLRFGSFEIFKPQDEHTGRKGPSVGRNDIRIQMLDYVIGSFYPEIQAAFAEDSVQRNAAFFREITRRTARLVADWQCVGFCHGVLNTDNMSIVGLTIDYGPFGFMDRYDPDHICNTSDTGGRYAYNKQPEVCKWNLQKLAEALVPELPLELSEAILEEEYDSEFERHYLHKMRQKLGLIRLELEEDRELVSALLETMHFTGADFTNTFYLLSSFSVALEPNQDAHFLDQLAQQCASLEELKLAFRPQMDPRQLSMMLMLAQSNPQLFALIGTKASINKELERIEQSSKLQHLSPTELISRNREHWETWLQRYRARLEREAQSTSGPDTWGVERVRVMRSNNPKYVLRNYIAQNAIEAAEQGDFSEVRRVLKLLEKPYCEDWEVALDPALDIEAAGPAEAAQSGEASGGSRPSYSRKPPLWAAELCVT